MSLKTTASEYHNISHWFLTRRFLRTTDVLKCLENVKIIFKEIKLFVVIVIHLTNGELFLDIFFSIQSFPVISLEQKKNVENRWRLIEPFYQSSVLWKIVHSTSFSTFLFAEEKCALKVFPSKMWIVFHSLRRFSWNSIFCQYYRWIRKIAVNGYIFLSRLFAWWCGAQKEFAIIIICVSAQLSPHPYANEFPLDW